jgi:hypothetical protein
MALTRATSPAAVFQKQADNIYECLPAQQKCHHPEHRVGRTVAYYDYHVGIRPCALQFILHPV